MVKQDTIRLLEATKNTRYQPGVSGNPNGRPRSSVTTILKNTDEKTNAQIAAKLIELAIKGDIPALIHYIDRTDGKVTDKLQLTGTMLVTTPDQLDFAMRILLEDKLKLEHRLLQEAIPLSVSNEQEAVIEGEVVEIDQSEN